MAAAAADTQQAGRFFSSLLSLDSIKTELISSYTLFKEPAFFFVFFSIQNAYTAVIE